VATRLGTVADRAVGSGPPLILVMGYGGTMETSDPRLVNALAQRYHPVLGASYPGNGTAVPPPRQGHAIDAWWVGQNPAGERAATITAPTLIADGAADQLDPAVNSRTLAGLIPGARLSLLPDAGHAFLFQDQAAFVPQIESFLG
jgi:pimeloyl-ACP methyl ester carboxylesterase